MTYEMLNIKVPHFNPNNLLWRMLLAYNRHFIIAHGKIFKHHKKLLFWLLELS